MELDSTVFSDVLSPLAAFSSPRDPDPEEIADVNDWQTSFLNPKNRIGSLEPKEFPGWRLDGVDVDGRRFFAVPKFAIGRPPVRIDVYVPPQEEHPGHMRDLLQLSAPIYISGSGLPNLPISQHLLRALEHWSSQLPNFEREYFAMPFGSQILVSNVEYNIDHMDIHLVRGDTVEHAMFSIESLRQIWNLPEIAWPGVIDWSELQLLRQPHEAISLVHIPSRLGTKELVFKSLIRDQKYLYHELKMLLTLPCHPNIIARPLYIVVKKCRFGGKYGVCGFVLDYYPLGSLKQRLADASSGAAPPVTNEECFRWSKQITEALIHINSVPAGFYPDLKPDNVVLSEVVVNGELQLDAVLLDLEQRGGWFSWSPPEIAYVEYMEILAARLEDEESRNEITELLARYIPGWGPSVQDDRYRNSDGGFSSPWLALMQESQAAQDEDRHLMLEKAQVFMLGKLIWCIFERQPFVRCGMDLEILKDDGADDNYPMFSVFKNTPHELRHLVKMCTYGAPEWEHPPRQRELFLKGGKLVPGTDLQGRMRWDLGKEQPPPMAQETQKLVRKFWAEEVKCATDFLTHIAANGGISGRDGTIQSRDSVLRQGASRPELVLVLGELLRLEALSRLGRER
jgi:hypothetical protein